MKKYLSLFVFCVLITGSGLMVSCEEDRDDGVTEPQVRIQNRDTIAFSTVTLGNDFLAFPTVPSGGMSDYQSAAEMPFFSTIRVEVEGITYSLDAALEGYPATLPVGFYTYALRIDAQGELVLEFKID